LLNAAVWVLLALDDRPLNRVIDWLLGSFSHAGWRDVATLAPWLAAGCGGLVLLTRPLDALAQGEDAARGVGLNVRAAAGLVLAGGSLATAAAVAAGRVVGFVG